MTSNLNNYFLVNGVTCFIVKYGVSYVQALLLHSCNMPTYEKLTKPLYIKITQTKRDSTYCCSQHLGSTPPSQCCFLTLVFN